MLLGDDREKRNLIEGATNCKYAVIVISKETISSKYAMEEMEIIKNRHSNNSIIVFPILYEILPSDLQDCFTWVKNIIFKEVKKDSGTREICNHIACKITDDLLQNVDKKLDRLIYKHVKELPNLLQQLIKSYIFLDDSNINGKVSLLYSMFLVVCEDEKQVSCFEVINVNKIFERIFTENKLNLKIDYRDIWLLENAIMILINQHYLYVKS